MAENLHVFNLCIELTRRCNMACPHCMRGEPENKDMNIKALEILLPHFKENGIPELTLTGGEPTLNPNAILTILNLLKKYGISLEHVYLVTNGKEVSDEFLLNYFNLVLYSDNFDELPSLSLSQDQFHDPISKDMIKKLKLFSFFSDEDHNTDWDKIPVIDLGRAKMLNHVQKRDPYKYIKSDMSDVEIEPDGSLNMNDATLTLTVNGNLLPVGDYSYEDEQNLAFCNVFDPDWFQTLKKNVTTYLNEE